MKTIRDMEKKICRRTFLRRVIYGLVSLELVYLLVGLLKRKRKPASDSTWFEAGDLQLFANGTVSPYGSERFYLARFQNGGMLAISAKCTHLGCVVKYNSEKNRFECPCHASAFSQYGEVLSPPATRALDIFPIVVRENVVLVDVLNPIRREVYDASQLTYA